MDMIILTATKLLTKHYNPSRQRRTPVSRDSKQLKKLGEKIFPFVDLALKFNANVGVIGISSSLHI